MRGGGDKRPPGPSPSPPVLSLMLALSAILCLPGLALAAPKVPASEFEPSEECGCHGTFLETWGESMHAQALSDPLYRVKLREADKATKGEMLPFCETCHSPIAGMGGLTGKAAGKRPRQASEGVSCDFCHRVLGTRRPPGTSSWVVKADGVKRAQRADASSPYHMEAYSAFHETAEVCGVCHDVVHPTTGVVLEATYSEWRDSEYARRGVVCQDCHMTPGPGVTKPNPGRAAPFGVEREHVYTMTFVGGNAALGPARLAEERLRSAAMVTLEASAVVPPGETLSAAATVANVGAGHYIPTGATELRRMWLDVVATDANGRELLRERREFGTEFADAEGRSPVEIWDAAAVAWDDRIPPGGFVVSRHEAEMPQAAPVTVTAVLSYRGVPEELARKAGVEVPVTEMTRVTAVVYGSRAQMLAASPGGGHGGRERILPLVTVAGVGGMLALIGIVALLRRGRDADLPQP